MGAGRRQLTRPAEEKGCEWANPLTAHLTRSSHVPNGRYRVTSTVMTHVSAEGLQRAAQ